MVTGTILFPLADVLPLASPWMNKLLDFILSITIMSAAIELLLIVISAIALMVLGLLGLIVRKGPFKTAASVLLGLDREWAIREMNKARFDSLKHMNDPHHLAYYLQERGLTGRQIEVALLAAENTTYEDIGQILGIEEGTVKEHMKKILKRLGLKNKREFIDFMQKINLES